MSKRMIRKMPQQDWAVIQKDLQIRSSEWQTAMDLFKKGESPDPGRAPRDWDDRVTGKQSRWLMTKSFSNYDETRWGPDPIDTVIDRLGIFDLDFVDDIKHAEEHNAGPTTLTDRTGTPEYKDKKSAHYPHAFVNDYEKAGMDIDAFPMFDSAEKGSTTQQIAEFIGMDFDKAQVGARRDYGYDLVHIQRPGQMLHYHHDIYYGIMREKDASIAWEPENFRRIVVFMEDWRPGHVWIAGNTTYSHWRKGECITWNWQDMPHGTANISMSPRYSLHLTGYMTDKSNNFYNRGHKDVRYRLGSDGQIHAYDLDATGEYYQIY